MGMFNSKEWAEVYNNGQPGSPNDEAEANKENGGDGGKAKNRVLRVDPRSISDDVERTPIQVDKAKKGGFDTPTPDTPTGIKTNVNRFKVSSFVFGVCCKELEGLQIVLSFESPFSL